MKIKCLLAFLFISTIVGAQSFQLDSSFQPFFDIRNQRFAQINDLYESKSKKLYITGEFQIAIPNSPVHNDLISIKVNGGRNFDFIGNYGGQGIIQPLSDSILLNGNDVYGFIDTLGNGYNQAWFFNYEVV